MCIPRARERDKLCCVTERDGVCGTTGLRNLVPIIALHNSLFLFECPNPNPSLHTDKLRTTRTPRAVGLGQNQHTARQSEPPGQAGQALYKLLKYIIFYSKIYRLVKYYSKKYLFVFSVGLSILQDTM